MHPSTHHRLGVGTCARAAATVSLLALAASLLVALAAPPAQAATDDVDVVRIAGASRTATAVELSRTAWPSGAATVVLARADAYADALAGSPLAAAMDAPVLLTGREGLPDEVASEVARLGAEHAVLLGGEGAVGPGVAADLGDLGLDVERIGGATRWETAALVARQVRALAVDPISPTRAFVVEGANADPARGWPDAVAVAPLAAQLRMPILLTSADELPTATAEALAEFSARGLSGITIVGGVGAVSSRVEGQLIGVHPVVDRVHGANRYATSAAVARMHLEEVQATTLLLASGRNWPDALVAGPAAAALQAPLLLTDPAKLPGDVAAVLAEEAPLGVGLVGGTGAVSDTVAGQVAGAVPARTTSAMPTSGSDVTVPAGQTMVLDRATDWLGRVTVAGTLLLEPGADLRAESVVVTGRLIGGTSLDPVPGDVRIQLRGEQAHVDRAITGTGGLENRGGLLQLVGASRPTAWTRLAQTAGVGTRSILLERAPGWQSGDLIVLAATGIDSEQAERAVVDSVDGAVVRLRDPLQHTHVAVTEDIAGQRVTQAGEVGLLSRPIVIEGVGDIGGHVLSMDGTADGGGQMWDGLQPTVMVRSVHLRSMGQAGILGRYAMHMHLAGPTPSARLDTLSVTDSDNRCVTIHGTSRVVLSRLVAHGVAGHCVFFEDGAESGNLVTQSLVAGYRPPADDARLLDTDREPAGFWVQHPSNSLIGNAAAGGVGHGIWCDLPTKPTGPSEQMVADQGIEVLPRTAPGGVFDRNAAHSNDRLEFRSGTGLRIDDYEPPERFEVTRTSLWQNEDFGAWLESSMDRVVLTGATVVGNRTGVQLHGATVEDSLVVGRSGNVDGHGYPNRAIGLYHGGGIARGVTIANFTAAHDWQTPAAVADGTHSHQFISRVEDLTLVNTPTPLYLSPGVGEDRVDYVGVVDLDGSLTGAPGTYVSHPPMVGDTDCDPVGGGRTWYRCGGTSPTTTGMFLRDASGGSVGVSSVTDAAGRTAPAILQENGAKADFVLGEGSHHVELGTVPTYLEAIIHGRQAVTLDVTMDWPHGEVWVYNGWGEWARPVAVATGGSPPASGWWFDASTDRIQLVLASGELDDSAHWTRHTICAQQYCGDGIGSARS